MSHGISEYHPDPEFHINIEAKKKLILSKLQSDLYRMSTQATCDRFDETLLTYEQKYSTFLSFKDTKGLKYIQNIKTKYKIGKVIGEGSFG